MVHNSVGRCMGKTPQGLALGGSQTKRGDTLPSFTSFPSGPTLSPSVPLFAPSGSGHPKAELGVRRRPEDQGDPRETEEGLPKSEPTTPLTGTGLGRKEGHPPEGTHVQSGVRSTTTLTTRTSFLGGLSRGGRRSTPWTCHVCRRRSYTLSTEGARPGRPS